jgi:hypothetical protein
MRGVLVAVVVACSLTCLPAVAAVPPSDWSGYGGGPTHTGVNDQERTL